MTTEQREMEKLCDWASNREIKQRFEKKEVKGFRTFHWKVAPIIGFGFWRDIYDPQKLGLAGETNNLILPFIRIQWGYICQP